MTATLTLLLGHETAPARGAPLSDIVPALVVAVLGAIIVAALAVGHRKGVFDVLGRFGDLAERVTGLPGWAGVPVAVTTASLLTAAFGFYWDVSWHIDRGRDPGPLANPAHWFIIVGLAGIALGGVLAIVMADERDSGASVRIREGWRAPIGGVLLTVCGVLALAGFPLDDAWHRIFGQDVTLWGPTHIQMVGGASLATLALWVLLAEGLRVRRPGPRSWLVRHQDMLVAGGFLIGLSTLQAEFDFGVPQFRQLYQPVLLMLAASIGLVVARIRGGRWAALGACAFFLVFRGVLTLLIGPVLGRSILHFPLYLVEALLVEAIALRVSTERQLTFGVACGVAIGTVGLAAEWAWSQVWMPLPWHASLLPEAAIVGVVAALAGGALGGFAGRALAVPGTPRQSTPRAMAGLAWAAAFFVIAWPLPMNAPSGVKADVRLTGSYAEVHLHPADAAVGANWFNVTSWQGRRAGDGGLEIQPLHAVAPGVYRTDGPVEKGGTWKTLVRLHRGRELMSMAVFLPQDEAIPAPEVPAKASFTRDFVRDKTILQREAVGGSIGLQRAAYAGLGLIALAWIASLAWGLRRLEHGVPPPRGTRVEGREARLLADVR